MFPLVAASISLSFFTNPVERSSKAPVLTSMFLKALITWGEFEVSILSTALTRTMALEVLIPFFVRVAMLAPTSSIETPNCPAVGRTIPKDSDSSVKLVSPRWTVAKRTSIARSEPRPLSL